MKARKHKVEGNTEEVTGFTTYTGTSKADKTYPILEVKSFSTVIQENLDLYNQHQLDILNPRTLYQTGMLNINTVLIRSSREERLWVVDGTVTIDLFSPETIQKIKQSGKHFAYVGLVVIGIKGLGR